MIPVKAVDQREVDALVTQALRDLCVGTTVTCRIRLVSWIEPVVDMGNPLGQELG